MTGVDEALEGRRLPLERASEAEWSRFDQWLWNPRTDVVWALKERFAPVDGRVEGVEERLGVEEAMPRAKTNPCAQEALEEGIEAVDATARLDFSLDDALAGLQEREEVEEQEDPADELLGGSVAAADAVDALDEVVEAVSLEEGAPAPLHLALQPLAGAGVCLEVEEKEEPLLRRRRLLHMPV